MFYREIAICKSLKTFFTDKLFALFLLGTNTAVQVEDYPLQNNSNDTKSASENNAGDNSSQQQPAPATEKLQPSPQPTTDMEVHHEPHIYHQHHGKKKFKEYLFEFLMLFLAVFLGFIAENIREEFSDKKRAHQFAVSLVQDLAKDTTNISDAIVANTQLVANYDSLLAILKAPGLTANTNRAYYYFWPSNYYYPFNVMEKTYQQLENAGELRLFTEEGAADTISAYYTDIKDLENQFATYLHYFDGYHELAFQVFSYTKLDFDRQDPKELLSEKGLALKTTDATTIDILYAKLYVIRTIAAIYVKQLQALKQEAGNTVAFLREKYSLN